MEEAVAAPMTLELVVSSGSRDPAGVAADARALPREAALLEVRLDRFAAPAAVDLERLAREIGRPALLTLRTTAEGGEFDGGTAERLALLGRADRAGFAWIDVEEDLAGLLPRGRARRIVSWHGDLAALGLAGIDAKVRRLAACDADVLKLAATAAGPAEALAFVRAAAAAGRTAGRPLTAIPMGSAGRWLRPLAGLFAMPLLYAAAHPSRKTAAGQVTAAELLEVQRALDVGPHTQVHAVAGADVTRSLSPRAHNEVFRRAGIDAVYVGISAAGFAQVAEVAAQLPLHGLSVTAPFKLDALAFAAAATAAAAGSGAANTLARHPSGRFLADNTDAPGFVAAVDLAVKDPAGCMDVLLGRSLAPLERLDGERAAAGPPPVESALVYGTGGVARGIAYGLSSRGVKVSVTGRDPGRAAALALTVKGRQEAISPGRAHSRDFPLLVKAVPDAADQDLPLDPFDFSAEGYSADVVISPLETEFLLASRRAGRTAISGLLMFAEQAVLQAARFTGLAPAEVRPHVAAGIAKGVDLKARRAREA